MGEKAEVNFKKNCCRKFPGGFSFPTVMDSIKLQTMNSVLIIK